MIPRDKQLHFLAGLSLALIVGSLFGPAMGLGAAVVAGVAKELYDMTTGRGTPEWADLWFTLAGGLLGSLIIYGI